MASRSCQGSPRLSTAQRTKENQSDSGAKSHQHRHGHGRKPKPQPRFKNKTTPKVSVPWQEGKSQPRPHHAQTSLKSSHHKQKYPTLNLHPPFLLHSEKETEASQNPRWGSLVSASALRGSAGRTGKQKEKEGHGGWKVKGVMKRDGRREDKWLFLRKLKSKSWISCLHLLCKNKILGAVLEPVPALFPLIPRRPLQNPGWWEGLQPTLTAVEAFPWGYTACGAVLPFCLLLPPSQTQSSWEKRPEAM